MKHQNKTGPAILGHRDPLEHLSSHRLRTMLEAGTVLIDTRSREAFQAANLPGSLHLPNTRNFATWASWLLEPHHDHVLFATNAQAASELLDKLAHIGVDRMLGFTTTLEGLHLKPQAPLTLAGFHRLKRPFVLDVRTKSEFEAGHLPQATHIHVGRLLANLERIPRDRPVVVHCQGGARSAAAVSALNALGLSNALDLDGGYEAWLAHGMVNA